MPCNTERNRIHENQRVRPGASSGASSGDVLKIYNMLPENTFFELQFFDADDTSKPLEAIGFLKCGNPLEKASIEDHIMQMKEAFRRWGYDNYRSLLMEWNRGFGNSVLLQVVL